jgi:aminobenzoyl-glutamate utilization protein B
LEVFMRFSRLAAIGVALVVTVTLSAAPPQQPAAAPAPNPQIEQYKRNVGLEVDSMQENIQKWNDSVFSFAEPGFQEFETSKYLTAILKQNGFSVQEGVAGIPTAWMATWGSGKPVIALGSDIDDIPQASQKPGVAWHEPIIEGAPGHGEGHNSGMPLQIAAALAVKKIMEQQHLQGTLKLWPGVAEELLGTKAYYVRAGLFKDVDVCIFAHVGANMQVSWGDSTNNGSSRSSTRSRARAPTPPARRGAARSALDAVELMDIGWNFRREHLRLQQRSHYVIPNGGDQPNVVPPTASVWYYFRETNYDEVKKLWDIGNTMAKAATMMTDTEYSMRVLGSAWPGHMNKTVAETMYANIEKVGLPQWSEADQALAKAVQREMKVPETGLATKINPLRGRESIPDEEKRGGGSDDIGDIAWNVPTVTLNYPSNIQAGPGHNWANAISMATPIAHKGHPVRRESRRADGDRSPDAARARDPGVGLLQERPDQGPEVRAADSARGYACDLAEQRADGEVPAGNEEVLLRPDEVQDLSRSAGHQVPDDGKARDKAVRAAAVGRACPPKLGVIK